MYEVRLFEAQLSWHILNHFPLLWLWDYIFSQGHNSPEKTHQKWWVKKKRGTRRRCSFRQTHYIVDIKVSHNQNWNWPLLSLVLGNIRVCVAKHCLSQLFTGPPLSPWGRNKKQQQVASFQQKDVSVMTWPSYEHDSEVAVRGKGSTRWWHHAPCYQLFHKVDVIQQSSFQSHAINTNL